MSRLNAMRLTVSSSRFLKKMDELAVTFDNILDKEKESGSEMLKKNHQDAQPACTAEKGFPVAINTPTETTVPASSDVQQISCDPDLPPCNQTSTTLNPVQPSALSQGEEENCSPTDAAVIDPSHGFNVVVDNWDLRQEVRHMTSDHQNTDIHWVNHNIVENRVSGNHLPDDKPVKDIMDVENKDLIPSIADHKELYNNFLTHIQRVLIKRIPSMQCLASNVPIHIRHKHSKEMSKKSKKVFISVTQ